MPPRRATALSVLSGAKLVLLGGLVLGALSLPVARAAPRRRGPLG